MATYQLFFIASTLDPSKGPPKLPSSRYPSVEGKGFSEEVLLRLEEILVGRKLEFEDAYSETAVFHSEDENFYITPMRSTLVSALADLAETEVEATHEKWEPDDPRLEQIKTWARSSETTRRILDEGKKARRQFLSDLRSLCVRAKQEGKIVYVYVTY
jgi:hypothetical protein